MLKDSCHRGVKRESFCHQGIVTKWRQKWAASFEPRAASLGKTLEKEENVSRCIAQTVAANDSRFPKLAARRFLPAHLFTQVRDMRHVMATVPRIECEILLERHRAEFGMAEGATPVLVGQTA